MATNAITDMLRQKESQTKGQIKVVQKDQLPCRRSLDNWVVCLKILFEKKLFYLNRRNWNQSTPSNSPRAPGTKLKIRERKVPSRGIILKWSPHERCPCAPRSHEKDTLHQERCARKAAWDMARNTYKLKNLDKTTFYTPIEKGMAAPASTRPEERELVVDSGASMHMMSKKRINLRRDGHSKKVQNPCSSVDCKRRGANPRGGTSVRS